MKVEFEFDGDEAITPIEGVGALYCYDADGQPLVLYGNYGNPSSLAAVGLFTVGLRDAESQFDSGEEYGE